MRGRASKVLVSGGRLWILLGFAVLALVLLRRLPIADTFYSSSSSSGVQNPIVDERHLIPIRAPQKGPGYPPVLAYSIFGSGRGDGKRMLRLLKAIYHPRNQYLLHLGLDVADHERSELALSVQSQKEFRAFRNVHVVGRSYADAVNQMGASGLAAMLHAAALLLKLNADWDWFTALSASSDYPLLTQDDILYAFTDLPRDLNFIHYYENATDSSKETVNEIIVDPSLYTKKSSPVFAAAETRELPDAFKICRGSEWMILSRSFVEHCVSGWDNLPRKLVMYFANVAFPLSSYFHTVLCNSPEFRNTTLNNTDLSFNVQSLPLGLIMNNNNKSHYDSIVLSPRPAIFGRTFICKEEESDPRLEELDTHILNRPPAGLVPGKWCIMQESTTNSISSKRGGDYCPIWDDIDSTNPGYYGFKLHQILSQLDAGRTLHSMT